MRIHYLSHGRLRTDRLITIVMLDDPSYDEYGRTLYAYCHLRREMRHFRSDGIKGIFDPETGEVRQYADLAEDPSALGFDPAKQPRAARVLGPETFDEAERLHRAEWEQWGWRVQRKAEASGEAFEFYRPNRKGDDWLATPEIALVRLRLTSSRADPKTGIRKVSYGGFRKSVELRVKRRENAVYPSCAAAFADAIDIVRAQAPIRPDA